MKKSAFSTKMVVATAIGAALFFVVAKFVSIPSFIPNTNFSLQYGILSFVAALFGPVAGGLVGFIGHTLNDLTWGSVWWTWAVGSGVHGVIAGLAYKKCNLDKGTFGKKELGFFLLYNLIACVVAWLVLAPVGDIVVYAEDASKVFAQGVFACIANFLVSGVIGGLLCLGYTKTIAKEGSLDKE